MNEIVNIPEVEELTDWLESIPKYQREIVSDLLEHSTPEEAASIWLDSSTENNSPFSSDGTNKKYSEYVFKEIHKLLCGNPTYSEERNELNTIIKNNGSKEAVISCISAAIGSQLGLAAAFVAPAVVLLIITAGKVTVNAWCEMHQES